MPNTKSSIYNIFVFSLNLPTIVYCAVDIHMESIYKLRSKLWSMVRRTTSVIRTSYLANYVGSSLNSYTAPSPDHYQFSSCIVYLGLSDRCLKMKMKCWHKISFLPNESVRRESFTIYTVCRELTWAD